MLSLGLDFHQPHRGMSLGYPPERCGLSEWWSNLVYLNRKGKIKGEYSVANVYVAFFTMCTIPNRNSNVIMDFISFPLLYFKIEPGNTDPALNQSNAELKQPCLSCNSGNFFVFRRRLLGHLWNFSLTVLIIRYHSFCFTIRYVNALCRHLSKELYSFYLKQPAAVKSCTIT